MGKKKQQNDRTSRPRSIFPRNKKGRREVELFGGVGVALVSALVVSIFVGSSIDRYFITSTQYASVLATVLVDLTNGDRSQNNLGSLQINPLLTAVAQAKANDMAAKSYFAHISPEGLEPWHWFKQVGYAFDYAGENLAIDFSESGDVERAWMNSPTHRGNILNPNFTEIGIAVAQGTYQGRSTAYVVQVFGTPSASGKQEVLAATSIPAIPGETALASSAPAVLGEVSAPDSEPTPVKKPIAQVPTPEPRDIEVLGSTVEPVAIENVAPPAAASKPVATTAGSTPKYASFWAHLLSSPKTLMQYMYWALAILIVVALGVAVEWEIKLHHTRKAVAAGVMLSFMLVMFIAANTFVFVPTSISPQASMAASVAAALR